jgi:5-methyltetrahydropteroyltriglutamate--homocysteine methyltransferase
MTRSTDRILTTHVGSLPRPADLDELLYARDNHQPYDADVLAARVHEVTAEVVSAQIGSGIDLVCDGEVGKIGYSTYVKERLSGFDGEASAIVHQEMMEYPGTMGKLAEPLSKMSLPACNGPVSLTDPDAVHRDIAEFKAALSAAPGDREPTGFTLQVDCPDLAMTRMMGDNVDLTDEQYLDQGRLHVRAINHALRDIPEEQMRLHLCWGNGAWPHVTDIPMSKVVEVALEARPAGLSFEMANPAHAHEWQVWEDVKLPEGKVLIPGVLDSCTNYVEHPELVAQRLVAVAKLVGRENVIAGTDCGFGTFAGLYSVDPPVTWLKFRAMAEGARIASERLW